MTRRIALGILLVWALVGSPEAGGIPPPDLDGSSSPTVAVFSGVWKMCFEPDLRGLSEPSAGYLVLMPDRRYYRVVEGCCRQGHEPPVVGGSGTFAIEQDTVVLSGTNRDGERYELRYQYLAGADVVLFDDLNAPPSRLPVLRIGDSLNYGYAKVFWREAWRPWDVSN